jgi:hypothetical protein
VIIQLPTLTDGTPFYSFRTQLEGSDFEFTFRYGERRGGWVFDMHTLEGEALLLGTLVTIGRDFLRRCVSDNRPPGQLWALNVVADLSKPEGVALPGLFDLGAGGRARLYYTESTTAAENAALGLTLGVDNGQ